MPRGCSQGTARTGSGSERYATVNEHSAQKCDDSDHCADLPRRTYPPYRMPFVTCTASAVTFYPSGSALATIMVTRPTTPRRPQEPETLRTAASAHPRTGVGDRCIKAPATPWTIIQTARAVGDLDLPPASSSSCRHIRHKMRP